MLVELICGIVSRLGRTEDSRCFFRADKLIVVVVRWYTLLQPGSGTVRMSELRSSDEMVFLDEFVVGDSWGTLKDFGPVDEKEMLDFARKWDPLRIHTDEEFAKRSQFKQLTASSAHIVAIKSLLLHAQERFPAIVATKTWHKHTIHRPVVAGDILTLRTTVVDILPHRSRQDAGWMVVKIELLKKPSGEVVLSMIDEALVMKRSMQPQAKL